MFATYAKVLDLLTPPERRRFYGLVCLTLAMGLVDMLGVASIMPFLAVLANPDIVETSAPLALLSDWLGAEGPGFLLALGFIVFLVVVGGLVLRAFTFYALTRFTRMRMLSLSTRLFKRYLDQPYGWFLDRSSADLGKSLLSEIAQAVNGPIDAAMRLLAQSAIVFFIVVLLLALEPVAALAAGLLLGGGYTLVFLHFQRRLTRMGVERAEANRERFEVVQEALGGIKEVKILDLEARYREKFLAPARKLADRQARVALVSETPRHILEGTAFGGMILFVLWLISTREGAVEAILPALGAFAFAGARLFPALQEIFRALTQIRFGAPALDLLHADLRNLPPAGPAEDADVPAIPLNASLTLENVTFAYSSGGRAALDGLSLRIEANTTVGLVGATGAGKSTIVDVILGLLAPQSGVMTADGVRVGPGNMRAWRRSIGYVPQSIFLTDDDVAANIAFGQRREEVDTEAVERAARAAEVHDFVMTLPDAYSTRVGERGVRLSGGQRQRIGIARALYRDPQVLVFDEATSALDTVTERAVMDAVNALGHRKTIILIAHRLSTVRNCDRIFVIEDGKVSASGTYDDLVSGSRSFRAIHQAAT